MTTAKMPGRNSTNVVWINTELHRCTAMEEDVSYPHDMRQGRDCQTPVPRYSILAGKPVEDEEEMDNAVRGLFWRTYFAAGVLLGVCAFLMAVWPN